MFGKTKTIHMVGIGGIGMSGIAEFLLNQGFIVSGSDIKKSNITNNLIKKGIKIIAGHNSKIISKRIDLVVFSSAISMDNPEIIAANEKNIPVVRRAEMLAEIMRMRYGIAISGTHGKTTTTSLTGFLLREANLNPTIIVGGIVDNFDSNSLNGNGEYLVVEADEYDRSFLSLSPIITGITNIELDHKDCYPNIESMKQAYIEFANKVPFFGTVVACLDDEGVQSILPKIKRNVITYGFSRQAEIRAENIKMRESETCFDLIYKGKNQGSVRIELLGKHMVLNSLLAVTIGCELGIPFKSIIQIMAKFKGVQRRLQKLAEVKGVIFFDDYAHHPTEIKAMLSSLRSVYKNRIVALFQPHLFSRTRDFYSEFARSFIDADKIFIAPIYQAREKPIDGISSKLIYDEAVKLGHRSVYHIDSNKKIVESVVENLREKDIFISFGAGDINSYNERIIEKYRKK